MNDFEDANVFIRDPVGLREKLKALMEGGAEKIQVWQFSKLGKYLWPSCSMECSNNTVITFCDVHQCLTKPTLMSKEMCQFTSC